MKSFLSFLCSVSLVLGVIATAHALSITGTLTADNHYGLYYGDESQVQFVGRNEVGPYGSGPGKYNWSDPETYTFEVEAGDYLYVAAWSDDIVAQGWIGEFSFGGSTKLTNTSDWEVLLTDEHLDDYAPELSESDLFAMIGAGTWGSIDYSLDHGDGPWGSIAGLSDEADWVWGTPLMAGAGYSGEFQIFRTQVEAPVPTPEPATFLLLGSGLFGLSAFRRKRRK